MFPQPSNPELTELNRYRGEYECLTDEGLREVIQSARELCGGKRFAIRPRGFYQMRAATDILEERHGAEYLLRELGIDRRTLFQKIFGRLMRE